MTSSNNINSRILQAGLWCATTLSFLFAGIALAERSLPRGEETPFVVQQVYLAPAGELHVTHPLHAEKPIRLLFMANSGATCELTHVEGGEACVDGLLGAQIRSASACVFAFVDVSAGCDIRVDASQLKPSSLFQSVRRTHKRQWKRREI